MPTTVDETFGLVLVEALHADALVYPPTIKELEVLEGNLLSLRK